MNPQLNYASCPSFDLASTVLFAANTTTAGCSESFLGKCKPENTIFSANFVREADNESPSLPKNLMHGDKLYDLGNTIINGSNQQKEVEIIKEAYRNIWQKHKTAICLGGDHIIKYAALQAISESYHDCWILYVDAHPDCNRINELNYSSILHWGFQLPGVSTENVGLLGVRQVNMQEAEALRHYNPYMVSPCDISTHGIHSIYQELAKKFSPYSKLYLSIDLDGLDPACAPAVEAPYPGGVTLNEMLILIRQLVQNFTIIGMDISELIPCNDSLKITALTTSRLIKEVHSLTARNNK